MPGQAEIRDYYLDKIHEYGYISVPFSVDGSDIGPLFTQFREFLDICDEPGGKQFSDALAFKSTDPGAGGDYFVNRRRVGSVNPHSHNLGRSTEDKDVAHIGPRSLDLAYERLGGKMPSIMRQFLESCVEIHEAAKKSTAPVFEALGIKEIMFANDRLNDQHVVRLLRYLGTTATHKSNLHFDLSAFTLAVWESSPGLVGTPGNNAQRQSLSVDELDIMAEKANVNPIKHRSGRAKLFAGAGYNRFPDEIYERNGRLPLLLHGVLNEEADKERDAVVVFMHPPAGLIKDYIIPTQDESGIETVRQYMLRRRPPSDEQVA